MGSGRASRIVYQETCGVVVSGLAGRRAGFVEHSPFDFQAQIAASRATLTKQLSEPPFITALRLMASAVCSHAGRPAVAARLCVV